VYYLLPILYTFFSGSGHLRFEEKTMGASVQTRNI